MKNVSVDLYLDEGCGRCSHYQTPECKVHTWHKELVQLRRIVLDCGLQEEFKWSQPCYTYKGKNVLLVTAFVDYACISFFKGSLIEDSQNLLTAPGKSSQAARQLRFTDFKKISEQEDTIRAYVFQAVEIEKAGLKVKFEKNHEAVPDELRDKLENDESFRAAFNALTPGRQRGYILHFSQAKQSATRTARIEKYTPHILRGEGIHDGYRKK